jgi:hypothetical protein
MHANLKQQELAVLIHKAHKAHHWIASESLSFQL